MMGSLSGVRFRVGEALDQLQGHVGGVAAGHDVAGCARQLECAFDEGDERGGKMAGARARLSSFAQIIV